MGPSTKARIDTVLIPEDKDPKSAYKSNIRFQWYSLLISNFACSAIFRPLVYKDLLTKEEVDTFRGFYNIPTIKDVDFHVEVKGDLAFAKMKSFNNENVYDIIAPFLRKNDNPESVLNGNYSCNCPNGSKVRHDVNLNFCYHMGTVVSYLEEKGGHHWGFAPGSRNTPIFAKVIEQVVKKYKRKLQPNEYYDRFGYQIKLSNRIIKEDILPKPVIRKI